MIFRPKIFISSTFKENEKIREDISEYFYSVGAEPLLYENELTPSVIPMTYRSNILDADFVILIIKDDYGTKTERGISGIHEEYKIANYNKIPLHVYLKKSKEAQRKNEDAENEENPLIKELKRDQISYYYFDDDDDLLKRLKETTFTIAKEIMVNQITQSKLPENSIIKLAGNRDYMKAMEVITIIESMQELIKREELDFIYTNVFIAFVEPIKYEFLSVHHNFINWKLDESLENMLKIADEFFAHSVNDFICYGLVREYKVNILDCVEISNLKCDHNNFWGLKNYKNLKEQFFREYETFKKLVQNMKTEIDIIE